MNPTTENKLKKVLGTARVLSPISIRLVLNEDVGQTADEDLRTFIEGKNKNVFQEADVQFYRIMKSQKKLVIPSIEHSNLLSALELPHSMAVFLPIQTEFGYCGCFWGCFEETTDTDPIVIQMENFAEWITDILWNAQRNDFNVEAIAQRYADFLEQQKTPALIVIYPDQISISNPSFEAMNYKEKVIQLVRRGIATDSSFMELINLYQCSLRDVSFPDGKTGKIFLFNITSEKNINISFNSNELDYFALMIQKALGCIDLVENTGTLTQIQLNHKEKATIQLNRIKTLVQFGKKHYLNFLNSREGAFEIIVISDLIKEVVFDLKSVAKKKNLDIIFEIEKIEGSPSQVGNVIGDAWLLTLTVFNLLDNAIRYSKPNSKPIKVDLSYQIDSWVLAVQDFGIGISPLDLEKMMEKTIPQDGSQTIHGLDFVKYVVKLHRGKMEINSRLGKGSTFSLEIPYY